MIEATSAHLAVLYEHPQWFQALFAGRAPLRLRSLRVDPPAIYGLETKASLTA